MGVTPTAILDQRGGESQTAVAGSVAGVFSDVIGIQFPFILTGILALAVFLFYAPRSPEFFGPVERVSAEPLVTHEGTV